MKKLQLVPMFVLASCLVISTIIMSTSPMNVRAEHIQEDKTESTKDRNRSNAVEKMDDDKVRRSLRLEIEDLQEKRKKQAVLFGVGHRQVKQTDKLIAELQTRLKALDHPTPENKFEVTTAEEYLQLLADNNKLFFPKLPKSEADKVAAHFRKQFPFKSIEKRLEYEKSSTKFVEPKVRDEKTSKTKPKFFLPTRTEALRQLHSDAVEKFINADLFGISRMPQVTPRLLFAQKSENKTLVFEMTLPTEIEKERVLKLIHGDPQTKKDENIAAKNRETNELPRDHFPTQWELGNYHNYAARLFTNDAGYVKNLKEVAGNNPHLVFADPTPRFLRPELTRPAPGKSVWRLNRLELVSLLKQKVPRVYVSDKLPNMEELDAARTRGLNEFEQESLAKLFKDESLVIRATASRIQILGALRAKESCLKCHRVKENELLGAFSYELLRQFGK